jgi:hypothetical protein
MSRRRTTRTVPIISKEQIQAHQVAMWNGWAPVHEGIRWRDNMKSCRTCAHFGHEDFAGRIWCANDPRVYAVYMPEWGCAGWMREPGADLAEDPRTFPAVNQL